MFYIKMITWGKRLTAILFVITFFVCIVNGHSCQCEYEAQRCMQSAVTPYGDGVYKVTARPTPAWPAGMFCMAIPWNLLDYETLGSSIMPDENVKLLFSADIRGNAGTSNIGVALNYHDCDHYDALYFRLHSRELVQGSVVNGQWEQSVEVLLPDDVTVSPDQFFTIWVEVYVRTRVVKLFVVERDNLVHEYTSNSTTTGAFGLVTANGNVDHIAFTNVEAKIEIIPEPTEPAPLELRPPEVYRCGSQEAVINADGSWTVKASFKSGLGKFCYGIPRDIINAGPTISSTSTEAVVYHFKIKGATNRHTMLTYVGMVYNIHDVNTYDAFYFSMTYQKFYNGKVEHGVFDGVDAALPNGIRIPNHDFFDVWVEIYPATKQTSVYAINRDSLVRTFTANYDFVNVFGLATVNWVGNVATFKDITISVVSEPEELGPPEVYNCASEEAVGNADGSWTVAAHRGSWSNDNLCYGIPRDMINAGPTISSTSTDIITYHFQLKGTPGRSHVGMAFNIHDNNNYDAFYFSIEGQDFFVGTLLNGDMTFSHAQVLPKGIRVPNNDFFDVWVDIIPAKKKTSVFANTRDSLVLTFLTHFDFVNVFGLATANGYDDSTTFKDVKISVSADDEQRSGLELHSHDGCSGNVGGAFRVTALSDINWPGGMFCMAIPWDIVKEIPKNPESLITSSGYVYHALLKGTDYVSHIGFAFNIKDVNNFEFFYLRIHGQQLVIGHVVNDVMFIDYDAALPLGVDVPNDTFFPVWFEISSGGLYASIYVHDRLTLVHSFSPIGPLKLVFGLITGNGYTESVTFKDVEASKYGCMESWQSTTWAK